MPARSYTIVGAGALGGYYGARLHHAGHPVRFLLHSDAQQVRRHGLVVESTDGDFSIQAPEVYDDVRDLPASDIVLVALKTTSNVLLPDLLPHAAGSDSAVLMMQNGLGNEADAEAVLPGHRLFGGLAFLCSNKVGPGHIRHLDYGSVRFGEHRADGRPGGLSDLLRGIGADFEGAGVGVDLEEDLVTARWKKLVWNVPFNGLCVVHGCTTDVLMKDPVHRELCESLMFEVLAAAEADGHPVRSSFVEAMLRSTDEMAAYSPSMKLDFDAGRGLEIDAIYRRPLAAASAAGVHCPHIEALYGQLLELDPARKGG